MDHPQPHHDQAGHLYAAAATTWWGFVELARWIQSGAPSWSTVPPLLFGAAALINAVRRPRTPREK